MKDKIDHFKKAMEGKGQKKEQVSRSLDQLGQELAGASDYPGERRVEAAIADSVAELENHEKEEEGRVAAIWRKLSEEVQHWEMEYPRITKILGDIAHGLANSGI